MEIADKLFKSQVGHLTTFMINIQRVFQKLVISQFVDSLKFFPQNFSSLYGISPKRRVTQHYKIQHQKLEVLMWGISQEH